ncbi:MAG: transposase [Acetobacteraceae bacterium]|nr:transposase [Acetobacteraceae bacterium]
MTDDSLRPFSLPSVERKKVTAAFDGGRLSSDGGVVLLALAERRIRSDRHSRNHPDPLGYVSSRAGAWAAMRASELRV